MVKSKYTIHFTKVAINDLDEIYQYITEKLFAENAATDLLERIENNIRQLKEFPNSGSRLVDEYLQLKGYRRIIVGSYIIFYIADDSGDVNIALRYLDKIETAINNLQKFPKSGSIPRYSILKKQGYRVVIVEKHLVFYKINEEDKTVIIYAIVDGRREYRNLI